VPFWPPVKFSSCDKAARVPRRYLIMNIQKACAGVAGKPGYTDCRLKAGSVLASSQRSDQCVVPDTTGGGNEVG
jgi:hypothetical protein